MGTYKLSLLGADTFEGEIKIENHDITRYPLSKIFFDGKNGYGSLIYDIDGGIKFMGYISMDSRAREVVLCLFEDYDDGRMFWSDTKGSIITYPVAEYSEIKNKLY